MTSFDFTVIGILLCGLALSYFLHQRILAKRIKQSTEVLQKKLSEAENRTREFDVHTHQLSAASEQIKRENKKIDDAKNLFEEKNKKLWQMSEAVYREKKKVDDEIEKLKEEKEKLEGEKKKVDEKVKKLWLQSTAIHKEKEKIEQIKAIIEQKHRDVTESITYAKRIQTAILPLKHEIQAALPDSFVLFMPRDIVSGDFYWFTTKGDKSYMAAVDCTGHGVPGAFMSMVGHTLLNEIIEQKGLTDPGKILNELDNSVRFILKQDNFETSTRDGMDVCLCVFNNKTKEVQYAGANRPLWVIRHSALHPVPEANLEETKATKAAIGGIREEEVIFKTHHVTLQKGDSLFLSTDGYADQFSPDDKKLMTRKFKNTLLAIQNKTMQEQGKYLEEFHDAWKGNMEQTDDVLVIGVRV